MISLKFDEITPGHISGKWKVVSYRSSSRAENFFLEGLKEITFLPDLNFIAASSGIVTGKWQLEQHKEIIANPVLSFELLTGSASDRAMITRYAYMPKEYEIKKNDEMIIYFSNGSEYVLEKIQA